MVRRTIENVDKLNLEKEKWWDVFLTCIRSKTVYYTKQKYAIENSTRDRIKKDIIKLEAIPAEQRTPSQASQYNFLKEKLKMFEEK